MEGRRNQRVAPEGIPFLALLAAAFVAAVVYFETLLAAVAAAAFFVSYLVFRDPKRDVPAEPLGVVSPVDGRVVSVGSVDRGALQGEAQIIRVRIDALGTYTARSPVEGKIMDLRSVADGRVAEYPTNAMWIRTDEGDDVVLNLAGYRLGLPPRSFIGYGERVGQGQRCAYLRLTRYAEIHLPIASNVAVAAGDRVTAGTSLIARLPYR
jgi:phosphatidylserine decarboxylase